MLAGLFISFVSASITVHGTTNLGETGMFGQLVGVSDLGVKEVGGGAIGTLLGLYIMSRGQKTLKKLSQEVAESKAIPAAA